MLYTAWHGRPEDDWTRALMKQLFFVCFGYMVTMLGIAAFGFQDCLIMNITFRELYSLFCSVFPFIYFLSCIHVNTVLFFNTGCLFIDGNLHISSYMMEQRGVG